MSRVPASVQVPTNKGHAPYVVFGTGPLGLAVTRRLLQAGRPVRVVNRSGRADVPTGVEVLAADATDPVAARRACAGAAVVFHCANAGYGRWAKTLPPIMEGIIAGAAASGARLVYGDNLDMYGPVAGPLTEDLPERPVGPNATVRARVATRLMREAHANGAVRASIGRASNFYGAHARRSIVGRASSRQRCQASRLESWGIRTRPTPTRSSTISPRACSRSPPATKRWVRCGMSQAPKR